MERCRLCSHAGWVSGAGQLGAPLAGQFKGIVHLLGSAFVGGAPELTVTEFAQEISLLCLCCQKDVVTGNGESDCGREWTEDDVHCH